MVKCIIPQVQNLQRHRRENTEPLMSMSKNIKKKITKYLTNQNKCLNFVKQIRKSPETFFEK